MTWSSTDICARCKIPRKAHMPGAHFSFGKSGFSSGGTRELPVLAVTCGDMVNCLAFIESGETVPGLCDPLPPRSLAFFNDRWTALHGTRSGLRKPHFAKEAA